MQNINTIDQKELASELMKWLPKFADGQKIKMHVAEGCDPLPMNRVDELAYAITNKCPLYLDEE